MADRKLVVEVIGDSSSLDRAFGRVSSSSSGLTSSFLKLGKAALYGGAALGGLATVGAVKAIGAASNLEEQINKTAVVFAKSGDEVEKWSEGLASSFGLSQRAALEAAGTYGNMLVPMGFARKEAADMSRKFVELAADMASFNNASPEETLDALRAGLAGETEPLRRFGVFLNDARIKAEAAAQGAKLVKGQLTPMAKAAATAAIIMKDTSDTQGDFGRTSESLANQQRVLRAELENAGAAIGKALLPAATAAVSGLARLIPTLTEFGTKIAQTVAPAVSRVADALGDFAPKVVESLKPLGVAFARVAPEILSTLEAIGSAIETHIVPVFRQFAAIAGEAIARVGDVLRENGPQIRQIFDNLGIAVSNLAKVVIPLLDFAFTKILPVAIRVLIPALVLVTGAIVKITQVSAAVAQFITGTMAPAFVTAFGKAASVVQAMWRIVGPIIAGIAQVIRGVVNVVAGIFSGDWSRAWEGMKTAAAGIVTTFLAWVRAIPARIIAALGSLAGLLYNAGLQILQGLWDGMKAKWEAVAEWVGSLPSKIVGLKGPQDPVLLTRSGELIMQSLQNGLGTGWKPIETWLESLPDKMADKVGAAIDAAVAAISAREGAFASAFDALAAQALAAFDRLTQAFETRTEKQLRLMDERAAAADRKRAIQEARAGLAQAQVEAQALRPEDFASFDEFLNAVLEAGEKTKAAQRALDEALAAQQRFQLEQQAARERKNYEERRELQRRHFEERLAKLQQNFLSQELTVQQFNQRLIALFKAYEVPFGKASLKLGGALAEGLREAMVDVRKAAKALASAIVSELSQIKAVVTVDLVVKNPAAAGRQHGGPVRRGSPYIVGEAGPELFVPRSSGVIRTSTNGGLAGGVNVTVHVGGSVVSERDLINAIHQGLLQKQRLGNLGIA